MTNIFLHHQLRAFTPTTTSAHGQHISASSERADIPAQLSATTNIFLFHQNRAFNPARSSTHDKHIPASSAYEKHIPASSEIEQIFVHSCTAISI
jgi:hypothetical protein